MLNNKLEYFWALTHDYYDEEFDIEEYISNELISVNLAFDFNITSYVESKYVMQEFIDKSNLPPKRKEIFKNFMQMKKGDYIIFNYNNLDKNDSNDEILVKKLTHIGIIENDFSEGYFYHEKYGHALKVKWIYDYERDGNVGKNLMNFAKLNSDENTVNYLRHMEFRGHEKEIIANDNNKWYLRFNYYYNVNDIYNKESIVLDSFKLKNCDEQINMETVEYLKNQNSNLALSKVLDTIKQIKKDDIVLCEFVHKSDNAVNKRKIFRGIATVKEDCNLDLNFKKDEGIIMPVNWLATKVKYDNYYLIEDLHKISSEAYLKVMTSILQLSSENNNIIFYGPSGTNKTFIAYNKALEIIDNVRYSNIKNLKNYKNIISKELNEIKSNKQILFLAFQNGIDFEALVESENRDGLLKTLAYEAFYEGLNLEEKIDIEMQILNNNNNISEAEIASLKKKRVIDNIGHKERFNFINCKNYVFIIDEINYGNILTAFRDLGHIISSDKRYNTKNEQKIKLPYSKEEFYLPPNLYVIGTMSTFGLFDSKNDFLIKNFQFEEVAPNDNMLEMVDEIDLSRMLNVINRRIEYLDNEKHYIGHAYFENLKSAQLISSTIKHKIVPILHNYLDGDWEKIGLVLGGIGENEDDGNIIFKKDTNMDGLFRNQNVEDKKIYCVKKHIGIKELKKIYE